MTTNLTSKLFIATSILYLLFVLTSCSYVKLKRYENLVASVDSVDIYFDEEKTSLSETQVNIIKEILVSNIEPELSRKFRPEARIVLFENGTKIGEFLVYDKPDNSFGNFVSEDLNFGFQMTYGIGRYLDETEAMLNERKENTTANNR